MKFRYILKTGLIAGIFTAAISLASVPAQSGHQQIFINGQPIHPSVVAQIQHTTGVILQGGAYYWDGQYLYDSYGNVVPLSIGGTGSPQYPYNRGGGSGQYPIVIDPSGGCEAGSCVNILD